MKRYSENEMEASGLIRPCYPKKLTPYLERLLSGPDGEIVSRQFEPEAREAESFSDLHADPLAEQHHTPVPGLVHRHPDRVLLLANACCAANCRFCFRRGRDFASFDRLATSGREAMFDYLTKQPEVREVILTGGDPLLLEAGQLGGLLDRLESVSHLELLRVHTRLPVVDPGRLSQGLLERLNRKLPLYVMLHVNHPVELTGAFEEGCKRLMAAGCILGSQSVLLKGVNDNVEVLEALFRGLLRMRVRPYYLHHPDLAAGTAHFRVSVERGRAIMRELAGYISGLSLPRYVVDLPGGHGKVAIDGSEIFPGKDEVWLQTGDGKRIRVPDWEG